MEENYGPNNWPEAASAEDMQTVGAELLARRREAAAFYEIMGWDSTTSVGLELKIEGDDPIFDVQGYLVGDTVSIFIDPNNSSLETNDFTIALPLLKDSSLTTEIIRFSFRKNSEELQSLVGARMNEEYVDGINRSMYERARTLSELATVEPILALYDEDRDATDAITMEAIVQSLEERTAAFGDNLYLQYQLGTLDKIAIERVNEILRRSSPVEPGTLPPFNIDA